MLQPIVQPVPNAALSLKAHFPHRAWQTPSLEEGLRNTSARLKYDIITWAEEIRPLREPRQRKTVAMAHC